MVVSANRRTEDRKRNSNDRKKAWSSLVLQFFCSVVSTVFTRTASSQCKPSFPSKLKSISFS
jgi:hypothetical protein